MRTRLTCLGGSTPPSAEFLFVLGSMGAVFFRDESDVEFSFHYVSRTDLMKSVMLFVTPETAVTEGESFVSLW